MKIYEYIQQGGPIMYVLVALNVIGLAIILSKFLVYIRESANSAHMADLLSGKVKSISAEKDTQTTIELARQELGYHVGRMEKGLNTVKIIATISPLLGLLGTVLGVLLAFKVMAESGLKDPSLFANGISMALITTVGGMIVAIPNFIGHNYLLGMLDRIETKLEKELLNKVL